MVAFKLSDGRFFSDHSEIIEIFPYKGLPFSMVSACQQPIAITTVAIDMQTDEGSS